MSAGEKERLALLNLEDALAERLLAMSDAELLAESEELGMDIEREAQAMQSLLQRVSGKARMEDVLAQMKSHRGRKARPALGHSAPNIQEAKGMTLAARNGTEQSEADVNSVAEDLTDLAAFDKEAGL